MAPTLSKSHFKHGLSKLCSKAEDATRALKETRQELQATKGQLRKLEQKGEGPSAIAAATATAAALQEQLAKLEAERTKQVSSETLEW
jgi:hypothetical protein